MNVSAIVQQSSSLMWLVLLLSVPVIVVASVVGVIVSLVQALTQVQDQTLPFLAKLIAVSITLAGTYRWMGHVIMNYAIICFHQIGSMR
jgi:type III secretion protein S